MAAAKKKELTGKQRLFVDYYTGKANCNATKAAQMAGYSHPAVEGCRTLRNVNVKAEIDSILTEKTMGSSEILYRLAEQARGSIEDVVEINEGFGREIQEWVHDAVRMADSGELDNLRSHVLKNTPETEAWCISLEKAKENGKLGLIRKLSYDRNNKPTVELYSSFDALVQLGRHLRLFTDRIEHDVSELTDEQLLAEARDRFSQGAKAKGSS